MSSSEEIKKKKKKEAYFISLSKARNGVRGNKFGDIRNVWVERLRTMSH